MEGGRTSTPQNAYTGIRAVIRSNSGKGGETYAAIHSVGGAGHRVYLFDDHPGVAVVFFLTGEPKPRFQKTALGFAAGVMTAASVWSLLLPAIDQAAEAGRFPGWLPAAAGMLAGVVFLRALDRPAAPS